MATAYQFRAYIGPAYEPATSARAYDWPAIFSSALDITATETTITATLGASGTSIALAATPQAAKGGYWIGPNGSGEAWEYVGYSGVTGNTLTGLQREAAATREHNGVHTSGAVARQWWPLTGDNGSLILSEQLNDAMSATVWQADLSGFLGPQAAIRQGHLVMIQTKAGAGAWTNALLGFVRQPRLRDDWRRAMQWQMQIVSVAQMVDGYSASSIRVGDLDLAKASSAQSDTALARPWKEYGSGEYVDAAPDLSGNAAIDGDPQTLWIAERYRGTAPSLTYPSNSYDIYEGRFMSGLRIRRWPGEPKGYRWLEFLAPNSMYTGTLNNGLLACKTSAAAVNINFDGLETSPGDLIIFCENQSLFEQANPLASPLAIFETGAGFFDALDLAGDAVAVYIGGWYPTIAWGTGGTPKAPGNLTGRSWSGTTIAAPGVGQVIRYDYVAGAANSAAYFKLDYVDMAGYRTGGEDPWVQVTLPPLGISLRDDITASSPGASGILYLLKGNAGGTDGLTASGTLQIGMEQITYSGRVPGQGVTVTARGANGTTAAAHVKGDAVRVLDTDGVATLGQLVSAITVTRKQAPAIESFKIRISNGDTARVPPDDNHDEDYTVIANPTSNAALSYTATLSPSRRVTNVIVEIDHMAGTLYRPRINDIEITADAAAFDSSLVLSAQDAANVVAKVLTNGGLPSGAVTVTTGAGNVDDLQTAEGERVWSVASDLAARTGVFLDCTRLGAVAAKANGLASAVLSVAATWTDINAASVEMVQAYNGAIGQVSIPYRLPDGTTGEARYPTDPAYRSEGVLTQPETRFATAGAATDAARRLFIRRRYPVQMVVTCADEQPAIRPGAVVAVQWTMGFGAGMQTLNRTGVVVAADHEIRGGVWRTVLTVAQLDREAVA
jgi:hypothetical protein